MKKIDKSIIDFFINNADILISLAPKLVENYDKKIIKLNFPGILNKSFNEGILANHLEKENNQTLQQRVQTSNNSNTNARINDTSTITNKS